MLEFSAENSVLIASALLIISVLASIFFYRNVIISSWKKYVLISLKSAAIFLVLMLFLQPVLVSLFAGHGPGQNVILIDNSRSINVNGKNISVEFIRSLNGSGKDIKLYTFSKDLNLMNEPDSFTAAGPYTDLSHSIEQLRSLLNDRPLNSITIISDGNFNEGGNPLYNLRQLSSPVITAAAGDSVQPKDVIVYNAGFNKTSFINTKTTITAYIRAFLSSGDMRLVIEREGSPVSEKIVSLKPEENLYSASFDITEGIPGKYKYRLKAENIPGEVTYKNNYFDFFIEFLDNKINLLYVSGGPSYDNAVISGILKRINNFNVTVRTLKTGNEFYEGAIDNSVYNDLSAIMLMNFPSSKFSGSQLSEISDNAKKLSIPVIFYAGRNSDYKKLEMIPELVPFTLTQLSGPESNISLQVVSGSNQDFSLSSPNLPELQRSFKGVIPKAGAITLITDKFSGEPVLITRNNGAASSTAFLAYGLWQWKLRSDNSRLVEELLEKSIRISLNKNRNKKFIITPAKEFFDVTEDVIIRADVFDEKNNPSLNAEIKGIIKDRNGTRLKDIDFKIEKGSYISNAGKIPTGDWLIEGEAVINNSVYLKDNNKFTSDSLNNEYLQTTNDYRSMRELSNNTGGLFTDLSHVLETISNIKNTNEQNENKGIAERINLRENSYFLALIILLFMLEWVIRKRNNIP